MPHRFELVDVFGEQDFAGNPLAVVDSADDLDSETMQRITRWLNLSETSFLLPPTEPDADYRVRIFTLDRELPFAGHPTLGSCHAWLAGGATPRQAGHIVQQCGAGLVRVRQSDAGLAFAAPPLMRTGPLEPAKQQEIASVLCLDPAAIVEAQWADNGPGWAVVLLDSADAVLALEPVRHHPDRVEIGVVGPCAAGGDAAFELRAFFSDQHGAILEDPVTGSLNAAAAEWLLASGRASAPYVASQGTRLGRSGRIRIDRDADGSVWVGGRTRSLFTGQTAF